MNLGPVGPVGPRGFPGIGTLTSSIGQTDFGENNQVSQMLYLQNH